MATADMPFATGVPAFGTKRHPDDRANVVEDKPQMRAPPLGKGIRVLGIASSTDLQPAGSTQCDRPQASAGAKNLLLSMLRPRSPLSAKCAGRRAPIALFKQHIR